MTADPDYTVRNSDHRILMCHMGPWDFVATLIPNWTPIGQDEPEHFEGYGKTHATARMRAYEAYRKKYPREKWPL